jgi:imidazolonepropionase-like amidohydrolase
LATGSWALVGGSALVGHELDPIPDAALLAMDGAITAVGARADIPIPDSVEIIETTGTTFLPGFIDAHVHIGFHPPRTVLAGGVTTVRDLGWPPDEIFRVAQESQSPGFDGPTVYAAGAMLTAPGGYPTRARWAPARTGLEVDAPAGAGPAVAAMVEAGATVIKIALNPPVGPTLDPDTLAAIVDVAHRSALKVTGHVYGVDELQKALDCGVDELAHMLMGTDPIPAATIDRMVQQGMAVVPTLAIRSGRELQVAVENLHRFRKAGGRVLYGTDLGNAGTAPGIDGNEIALMAASGMAPAEIVRSATSGSAQWSELSSTGILEAERDADVIVVGGDPLSNLAALGDVKMVFRRGRRAR